MSSLYIDGCSLTAGFADETKNWDITKCWPDYIGTNFSSSGYQGKDDHGIYIDTMKNLTEHSYSRAIIYWTYTDRHSFYDEEDGRVVRGVDKKVSEKIYEKGYQKLHYMYTHMSMCYMYSVQMLCEIKGIDYYFITTMPYQHYREASKFSNDNQDSQSLLARINKDRVLNWHEEDLACYDNKTDNWAHTLPVLFGTLHNCLNWDGVHLTEDGNRIFAEWVMDSINNGKSIPDWSVDKVFNWVMNNDDTTKYHRFTKAGYYGAKQYASKIKNYIYEGP